MEKFEKTIRQDRPIILDIGVPYVRYPRVGISADALAMIRRITAEYSSPQQGMVTRLLTIISCAMEITGLTFTLECLVGANAVGCLNLLLGAIYSRQFIELKDIIRYGYSRQLWKIYRNLTPNIPKYDIRSVSTSLMMKNFAAEFDKLVKLDEQVYLWRGWPATNRKGKVYWLPLEPFYRKLGRDFTDNLYRQLKTWYECRLAEKIPALNRFAIYIDSLESIYPQNLLDGTFVTKLFRDFWKNYSSQCAGIVSPLTMQTNWMTFKTVVDSALVGGGLIAGYYGDFPGASITPKSVDDASIINFKSFIEEIGISNDLIYSNDEIIYLVRRVIPGKLAVVKEWASVTSDRLLENLRARPRLAKFGEPRTGTGKNSAFLLSHDNENYLKNIAATYQYHGFKMPTKRHRAIYPIGKYELFFMLGIPTPTEIVAFCTLLVAEHPSITPSFLENFELYNKNDKLIGLIRQNGVWYLIGKKFRKGRTGLQRIKLNRTSLRIVIRLLIATRELRSYLKAAGNPDWKQLLIYASAINSISVARRLATFTSAKSYKDNIVKSLLKIENEISSSGNLSYSGFNLRWVRLLSSLNIFLQTGNHKSAANALGHQNTDWLLLKRYVPDEIVFFFRARIVRMFQVRLIVAACKESPHLLRATGFESENDLMTFLKLSPEINVEAVAIHGKGNSSQQKSGRIIFELSPEFYKSVNALAEESSESSFERNEWRQLAMLLLKYIGKARHLYP